MNETLSEDDERFKERILKYVKSYHARHGIPPSIGRVMKHLNTHYKRLKKVFLGGAVDVYTQAGVPIPKERIKKTEKAMRARMMKLARQAKAKSKKEAELVPPPAAKKPRLESVTLLRLDSLFHSTLNAVLKALIPLHALVGTSALLPDLASAEVDRIAFTLLEEVGKVDPEYVRVILEEQAEDGYLDFLGGHVLDFHAFHDEDLSETELKRRHVWMDLLKRYHSKLLAELISPSE